MNKHARNYLKHSCPHCGDDMDRVSGVRNGQPILPKPGDLGLCLSCGGWLVFAEELGKTRVPNAAETLEIGASRVMQEAHAAWRRMRARDAQ
jgi:predicted RNA-binding Zn-ribbon protein involved in translation (DUF1610 family)